MVDGDQGLDAVFQALVHNVLIEPQPFLIRLRLGALGKNPGPADGEAVDLESHFRKQGDILPPAVIVVDGLPGRIILPGEGKGVQLPGGHGHAVWPGGDQVRVGQAPAPLLIRSLALVGGGGAAPEEAVRHSAHTAASFQRRTVMKSPPAEPTTSR